MVVGGFDIAVDGILQFAGGAMNTPLDLLFGQGGEPALDQVQPRGAGPVLEPTLSADIASVERARHAGVARALNDGAPIGKNGHFIRGHAKA